MRIKQSVFNERQRQVFALYAAGNSFATIAHQLGITPSQVSHCIHKDTDNAAVRKWMSTHPTYMRDRYAAIRRMWIAEGEICVICLKQAECRHHISYMDKEFAFRELYTQFTEHKLDIEAEKAKTVPLCIHCHRQLHMGLIDRPDLYTGPFQEVAFDDDGLFNGVKTKTI